MKRMLTALALVSLLAVATGGGCAWIASCSTSFNARVDRSRTAALAALSALVRISKMLLPCNAEMKCVSTKSRNGS